MRFLVIFCCLILSCVTIAQEPVVDFTHADVTVRPNAMDKSIEGTVVYTFLLNAITDSIHIDAQQLHIDAFKMDGEIWPYLNTKKRISFKAPATLGTHTLYLEYTGIPTKALYFVGFDDNELRNDQIWTQGQGKYTSNWLPSFDDMAEKVEFDLTIIYQGDYTVIANGLLVGQEEIGELIEWRFDMNEPISSYLLAFAIGTYSKQGLLSNSGVEIENYFYPTDSSKVEPTYRYAAEIFDFLETEIGVPYPWQNYKQIPVHDFLYAGMENTGTTIFSDAYVIDSTAFVDRNYININAHELAHQWFGNLVTERSGNDHWLHEGFATYYAYLSEKMIFGEDYFFWKLFETAKMLISVSENNEGESLLDPKASSLTFYEKGAWALAMLRHTIGDGYFREGIKNYLLKYRFKNATVSDFILEMEQVSGKSLDDFVSVWLDNAMFPKNRAKDFLIENSQSIRTYYDVKHDEQFSGISSGFLNDQELATQLKLEVLGKKKNFLDIELQPLLTHKDLKIRQFAAEKMTDEHLVLKPYAEEMLLDKSYLTTEYMLYWLWNNFEDQRENYLNMTKEIMGLPNKNVRLIWLTLALITPNYNVSQKLRYYNELEGYTASTYNPEVRQAAFQYLVQIKALNGVGLKNLIKATNHFSWQFRNAARRLLDGLLDDDEQKIEIQKVAQQLNSSDLRYLKTKLNRQ